LLRRALRKRHRVKSRLEQLAADEGTNRFINTNRNQLGMLFGSFVLFTALSLSFSLSRTR